MLAVTFETFRQLTVDGFFRGCSYGLLGVGFALILGVTGRFHFAYGFTYTLAAYLAFTFTFRVGAGRSGRRRSSGSCLPAVVGCRDRARRVPAARRQRRGHRAAGGVRRRPRHRHRRREPHPPLLGLQHPGLLRAAQDGHVDLGRHLHQLRPCGRRRAPSPSPWPSRRCCGTRPSAARSRRPASTPTSPRPSASTPTAIYVIVLLPRHDLRRRGRLLVRPQVHGRPGHGDAAVTYAFVVAFLGGTARSPIRVFLMGIVVALIEQYSSIWLSVQYTQTAVFVVLVGYLTLPGDQVERLHGEVQEGAAATPLVPATAGEG